METGIEIRTVREVMSAPPITVRPGTGVGELKRLFETYDFNAFPVVDERDLLVGIVSKLDLLRMVRPERYRWIPELRRPLGERVEEIMSRSVVAVEPDDPAAVAVDRMMEYGLRSLPVVERGDGEVRLVGIVSRTDLLRCLVLESEAADGAS